MKFKILPPPIGQNADKINDASRFLFSCGVSRFLVSSPAASGFGLLRQGFLCLFMMAAFVACENPDIPESSPRMKELYFESCNLTMVQTDSIPRFANKFNNYITQNPEERKDPFYPDIRANIYDAADKAGILVGSLLINTEWDGENYVEF